MPAHDLSIKFTIQLKIALQWVKKNIRLFGVLLFLIVICFIVMLPRLRSTQFGLLDDGVTVKVAQALIKDPLKAFTFMEGAGRFMPAYWFSQILIYQWAGIASLRWFYVNLLLLVLDTMAVFAILRLRGASLLQSTLSGLFFCLSAPIFETFYTLSKPDLIMTTWVIWGVLFFLVSRLRLNPWLKRFLLVVAVFSLWMSIGTKEPAVALIGILLGWFVLSWLIKPAPNDLLDLFAGRTMFFSACVALVIYLGLRFYFVPVNPLDGAYSSNYQISLESISAQLLRWLGRFLRDFLFLLPLLLGLLARKVRQRVNTRLLPDSLVWMGGWVAIFLPWNALESFHTLPFAIGVAMAGGLCLGAALPVFLKDGSPFDRLFLSLIFIAFLFFGQFTLVNNISTARVQLFYDQVNSRMVKFLSRMPEDSTIYFNTPYLEYVVETGLHLQVFRDRQDLNVDYYRYPLPVEGQLHYYVVNPVMLNAPLPSVRNSLHENGVLAWQQCLQTTLNPRLHTPIFEGVETLRWTDFGLNRLLGLLGLEDKYSYEVPDRPFFESKVMTYGWQVYEIKIDPATFALPAGYDGAGKWTLSGPQGRSMVSHFGDPGDLPLTGDVNGDGQTDLILFQSVDHRFLVDLNLDGIDDLQFNFRSMQAGDIPLFGDWNGDGTDTPGYYRFADSSWHFSNDPSAVSEDTPFAIPTAPDIVPLAGDWDGDGDDTFGFYYPSTGDVYLLDYLDRPANFDWAYRGQASAVPVAADWYGFGRDTLAFVKDGRWMIRPSNAHCDFPNPLEPLEFEDAGDFPLGGRW